MKKRWVSYNLQTGVLSAVLNRRDRYRKEQRTVLKRQIKEIETPLGKLQVKEVEIDGEKRCYPEYESAKKLALKHQCSLQEIYHLVK